MFIVLLRLSGNKQKSQEFMAEHKVWIEKGVADGVFLVVGSLEPQQGGAVIVHGVDRAALEARVSEDPFVREDVVQAEILQISPNRAASQLDFLLR